MRIVRMRTAVVLALAGLALALPTVAQAEPVQQFTFQLTNLTPDGRFTLVFSARTFDTTGAVPPMLTEQYTRSPAGAVFNRAFLNKGWYCDGPKLRDDLNRDLASSGIPFTKRVADLTPFIRKLSRSRSARDRKALANAKTCDRARIGSGSVVIDARDAIRALDEPVPGKFAMFLSGPTAPGAIAGFTVLGAAVESAPVVRRNPVVAAVHVALNANFFNDPSPDGVYGYRLELPVEPVDGFRVSLAEIQATIPGLTIARGTCLKQGRGGRCAQVQRRTAFWFTRPTCPPSGQISFLTFFGYDDPQPDITKTVSLACPRFG
jgi:hypothetical protein